MKIIYWIATGLLCLLMLFSAGMYIFVHPFAVGAFEHLGFPTYIVYPLAAAKILAVIAILSNKSKLLKDFAYAGIFYDLILALSAHIMTDGEGFELALIGLILWTVSFALDRKLFE